MALCLILLVFTDFQDSETGKKGGEYKIHIITYRWIKDEQLGSPGVIFLGEWGLPDEAGVSGR